MEEILHSSHCPPALALSSPPPRLQHLLFTLCSLLSTELWLTERPRTTFCMVSILSVPLLNLVGLAALLFPVVVVVHGAAWLVSLQSLCASSSPRVCRTLVYI